MKWFMCLLIWLTVLPAYGQASDTTSCTPAKTGNPCASTSRTPTINLGAGNPIHLMSGNKFQHEQDMLLRLSGLEFSRFYNAMASMASPMGVGWSNSYNTRLFKLPRAWQILLDDGQRIMFDAPKTTQHNRIEARLPQQGYLQQNSLQEWEWHTPEGTVRTFNKEGYMRQLTIVGFPTIDIDYINIQQQFFISKVHNKTEAITFYYDNQQTPPLLTHITTPVGTFTYHYDIPAGFQHHRLIRVARADQWQREYLYEEQYQSGDPYRLTGITLISPQQQRLRLNEWHYQEDGKAIYSRSSFPVSPDKATQFHELYIEYARQAHNENDESLTIVRDQDGRETRITGIIRAGNYLLTKVTGNGCYLCPPAGTQATYNAKGQLHTINGFTLYRNEQGQIHTIEFEHPFWDTVRLEYDEQGYAKQWHTQITGIRLPGPPYLVKAALPTSQQDTHHAYFDKDTLIFKNGLTLKQINIGTTYRALVLEKAHKPIWIQARTYNSQGLLAREYIHFLLNDNRIDYHYLYDKNHRLIGALQQHPKQEVLYYYAWHKDGSSQAYAINNHNYSPTIQRNALGLPTQIGHKKLTYGKKHRIEIVKEHQHIIAQYRYDKYGRRIQKKTAHQHTDFYYQGNQLSHEIKTINSSSTPTFHQQKRQYFYRGVMPVAFTDTTLDKKGHILSTQDFYIHNDHLGRPIIVTDQHQNIRWSAYYSPTGKATIIEADIEFNLRQPGQYFDAETGWHDNYLRTYDPEAGHYLEPDPLGPLAWNDPYGYAAQQPRHFIDPVGLLLFAFDGTTNDKDSDTNVWKFYQLYQGPKFYKEGPGAIPGESTYSSNSGAFWGTTVPLILEEQKKNLINYMRTMNHKFSEVTPIDIVGFSRGAMMGMVFSNYVKSLVKEGLFDYQETFVENGIEKIRHIQSCVDLRFIGLFDTVAQLGFNGVYNHRFDYTAAPEWAVIAHAVALNEYRSVLPLTVYQGADNVIEQGFLGNHSDLGGVHVAYDIKDIALGHISLSERRFGDLGDIPLAWIYTQAQQIGVPLKTLASVPSKSGKKWSNPQPGRLDEVIHPVIHNTYGEYSTPNSLNPIKNIKNEIASAQGIRSHDRDLQHPNSATRFQQQGQSAHIGDKVRQEHIQAADVEFLWPYWEEPTMAHVSIYGKLNAEKYIAWLEQELNWKAPIKAVPTSL